MDIYTLQKQHKMKNILKQFKLLPLLFLLLAVGCNNEPDDKEIQEKVDETMRANARYEGITATVAGGVVTLDGTCDGENCATNIAQQLKQDASVDSVVNNVTQAETETDLTMRTSVQNIVSKYEGVQADVDNGVIILRGSIKSNLLQPLMNEISVLKPSKIDNQMVVN